MSAGKSLVLSAVLLSAFAHCLGADCEPSRRPTKTPHGPIAEYYCEASPQSKPSHYVALDGVKVLQDSFLARDDVHPSRSIWIFTGGGSIETGCATRLYLLDTSMEPVKVFAFGVKKACNEFHWASWGDKRSVIALKHNVKFVYENGKLTPPASGEGLWKAIEPPHAGAGLAKEDAVAFVEEVPLPKAE
jgi:hypothetical protein